MMHFSCDRCKCQLDPHDDLRYSVKIEIQAVMDPIGESEPEDDRDHLLEIADILEQLAEEESCTVGEDVYQKRNFDLCPACYRKFIQNPLGREQKATLGFSKN